MAGHGAASLPVANALVRLREPMMKIVRVAFLLGLGLGFSAFMSVNHAAVYHPFSVDAYHLSSAAAFMCAAAIGAILKS